MDPERKMSTEGPLDEQPSEIQKPSAAMPTNPLSLCDLDSEVVIGHPEGPGAGPSNQTGENVPADPPQKPPTLGHDLGKSEGKAGGGTCREDCPLSDGGALGEGATGEDLEDPDKRPMRSQLLQNLPPVVP